MSIDTDLKSIISPLVAGGSHNIVNRSQGIVSPYVVFTEISGTPENGITWYLGATRYRYQVDVFARSPEEAKGLAIGPIKAAIESMEGTLTYQQAGQYSDADRTYHYITEYYIWAMQG